MLDDLPGVGQSQNLEGFALPFPDVRIPQTGIGYDLEIPRPGDRLGGLHRSLERARVDRLDRDFLQRLTQRLGLVQPALIEMDPRALTGELARFHKIIFAVTD